MALDVGREAQQLGLSTSGSPSERVAGDEPGDRRRRRRAEAARQRDLVVHRDPPADAVGQLAAGRREGRLEAAHEPVVAVLGQLVAALALDGQLDLAAAPAADLDLDPVGQRERDARGSRSRRRGWPTRPGTSTVTRRPSSSASQWPAIVRPTSPARRRPRRRSAAASRNGGTWRSAVVGSLRPWPVRTHTTVASGSSSPAAAALRDARPRSPPRPARRRRPRSRARSR